MNRQVESVRQEIMAGVDNTVPVNFSRFKHRWIVDSLHSLVFNNSDQSVSGQKIRVTFSDGSETRPFPIGCLTLSDPPTELESAVRVGLNSGRHPEMDRFVEIYLFRNADVSALESIAGQEQYAFQQGMAFLQNPMWKAGGALELHQTGLEPLVVGFYRAVVANSLGRKKKGLPPVTILPRSWSPSVFSLRHYIISRLPGNLNDKTLKTHIQDFASVLEQIAVDFPGFFSLQNRTDDMVLKWLPERPMWQTELDFLLSRYARMRSIWQSVFNTSQFTKHSHWGYRI